MRINEEKLKGIIEELTLDKEQLNEIARALRFDMELALRGEEASMPMLCFRIMKKSMLLSRRLCLKRWMIP